jgi:propane monooxygenase small subunit
MLADDAANSAHNRKLMESWLENYVPAAIGAGRNLQPIWSQPSEKVVRFEDSFDRSRERFESLLGDIGISAPKGVFA